MFSGRIKDSFLLIFAVSLTVLQSAWPTKTHLGVLRTQHLMSDRPRGLLARDSTLTWDFYHFYFKIYRSSQAITFWHFHFTLFRPRKLFSPKLNYHAVNLIQTLQRKGETLPLIKLQIPDFLFLLRYKNAIFPYLEEHTCRFQNCENLQTSEQLQPRRFSYIMLHALNVTARET